MLTSLTRRGSRPPGKMSGHRLATLRAMKMTRPWQLRPLHQVWPILKVYLQLNSGRGIAIALAVAVAASAPASSALSRGRLLEEPLAPDTPAGEVVATAIGLAEQAEAEPLPAASEQGAHKPWWLTRTNRTATCNGCRADFPRYTFRLLCDPDKTGIDPRIWAQSWLKYYHLSYACIRHSATPLRAPTELQLDIAPLPPSRHESPELRREANESANREALVAFAAGFP